MGRVRDRLFKARVVLFACHPELEASCESGDDVRVHIRYKNGACEIIQQFFETFGREKSCMIEQEPFLQCVNSLLPQ